MRRFSVVCLAVLAAFAVLGHVRQDAVSEPGSGAYSQVVDNSDEGRFTIGPGWKTSSSGRGISGKDYRFARPADVSGRAAFKVRIPEDGRYAVYARWPESKKLSSKVTIEVETSDGLKRTRVDQTRDGGSWVRLGEFGMNEGDRYSVRVLRNKNGKGRVVADAVKVEKVEPEADRSALRTGAGIVQVAREHIGTPYENSPPGPCEIEVGEDCSCFTMLVFRRFGVSLADDPVDQYEHGAPVPRSELRPGDLVFFDENRNGRLEHWDHVGIYSGRSADGDEMIIHASNYGAHRKVVESEMKWLDGYYGARRIDLPSG